jgi:hypothetical protein
VQPFSPPPGIGEPPAQLFIMEEFDIDLRPEGQEGAEFRTHPPEFRKVVVQSHRGDALLARATIDSITHGEISRGGDPATLLVLEFRFISMQSSRRFTHCSITVTFEDSGGDLEARPEVHSVAPEGVFALNKTSALREVKKGGNVGANAGSASLGASFGYAWDMSEVQKKDHYARLRGSKKILDGGETDNAVVWSMEEDDAPNKKEGVPTFLRTAILLRREADVPFNFLIKIRSKVDFMTGLESELQSLFGRKKVEKVDPVQVDSGIDPTKLRVKSLDPRTIDSSNMGEINLNEYADVTIASLVDA